MFREMFRDDGNVFWMCREMFRGDGNASLSQVSVAIDAKDSSVRPFEKA